MMVPPRLCSKKILIVSLLSLGAVPGVRAALPARERAPRNCLVCSAMDGNIRTLKQMPDEVSREKSSAVAAQMLTARLREEARKPMSREEIRAVFKYLLEVGELDRKDHLALVFRNFARQHSERVTAEMKAYAPPQQALLKQKLL